MESARSSNISASASVPYIYRMLLLYFEPFCALAGTVLVLTKPENYVSTMTRSSMSNIEAQSSFIYTELAGGWLHFAFTEAVVLRLVDDLRVWRLLCVGMLLSDLAYCHSVAQAVGGWIVWINVMEWTVEDWTVTLTTWPFVVARLAIASGVGLSLPLDKGEDRQQ